MNQQVFLEKLTTLVKELSESKNIQLIFVSPTKEIYKWENSAFKQQER